MPYASQISPNECHTRARAALAPYLVLYGFTPRPSATHAAAYTCAVAESPRAAAVPRARGALPRSGAVGRWGSALHSLHGGAGGYTRDAHSTHRVREGERETTDDRESSLKRSSTIPIFTLQRGSQGPVA